MKKVLAMVFLSLPLFVMAAPLERDLMKGAKGDDVKFLQAFLAGDASIYPEGIISGFFGSLTKAAVIRFQKREHITPAVGYVGIKTKSRISLLIQPVIPSPASTSPATSTPSTGEVSSAPPADTLPPKFIDGPSLLSSSYATSSPGGSSAYRLSLTWKSDEPASFSGITCNPEIQRITEGADTSFWALAGGNYNCTFSIKDNAGNGASQSFNFSVPNWISLSGNATSSFAVSGGKLGDISIYNGSNAPMILWSINVSIYDAADAPAARGAQFYFVVRDGTTSSDPVESRTGVTLNSNAPPLGSNFVLLKSFYAGVTIPPKSTKQVSVWYEGLQAPFRGGSLTFEINGVNISDLGAVLQGKATFAIIP